MRKALVTYSHFLTRKEKTLYLILVLGRSSTALLDVAGIFSIGFVASSIANFVTSGTNSGQYIKFAGLSLPAITADALPWLTVVVCLIFLFKSLLIIILSRLTAIFIAKIEARAAKVICQQVLGKDLEAKNSFSQDELIFSIQTGTSAAFTGILNNFANIVSEGFLFLILSASFLVLSPLASFVLLVYFSILALLIQLFVGKKLSNASFQTYLMTVKAHQALIDIISAFRELAISGGRNKFFDKIYNSKNSASKSIGEQVYLSGMPRHLIESGLILGMTIFILILGATGGLISSASIISVFLIGGLRMVAALLPLQNSLVNLKINIPQAETTWGLLNNKSHQHAGDQESRSNEDAPLEVQVSNVSFKYGSNPNFVLDDVSLNVKAGQNVALIGPSGSGKSTLADLILGLITPNIGTVLINGVSAESFISSNPGKASYVPQDPGMISGTLRDNIIFGRTSELREEEFLSQIITQCYLDDLVDSLEFGLDTDIGPHRDSFSGGQRQRIGLARALYSRPKLLVLDESTSALDAESERAITDSLRKLGGFVTIISIAHRLNSIQNADTVHLLDGGRVAASGTLAELQKANASVAKAIQLFKVDFDN